MEIKERMERNGFLVISGEKIEKECVKPVFVFYCSLDTTKGLLRSSKRLLSQASISFLFHFGLKKVP